MELAKYTTFDPEPMRSTAVTSHIYSQPIKIMQGHMGTVLRNRVNN